MAKAQWLPAKSITEAKRLIKQGAIKVDGQIITDINYKIKWKDEGILIQRGKRYFAKFFKD